MKKSIITMLVVLMLFCLSGLSFGANFFQRIELSKKYVEIVINQ